MTGKRYTIWLLKIIQRFEIGAKNKVVLFSKMIKEHREQVQIHRTSLLIEEIGPKKQEETVSCWILLRQRKTRVNDGMTV
jgi:hypothetical protein